MRFPRRETPGIKKACCLNVRMYRRLPACRSRTAGILPAFYKDDEVLGGGWIDEVPA